MPMVPAPTEIIQIMEDYLQNFWEQWGSKKIAKLEEENKQLKEEINNLKEHHEHSSSAGVAPTVNSAEIEAIKNELATLRELIKNFKATPDQFDLKKQFPIIAFIKSKLVLDYVSAEITGKIINELFKKQLKKESLPSGFKNYEFSPRVIDRVLSLKEWITAPTSKFELGSMKIDNSFDTANPLEKKVSLGTGTGKSTFFLRCLAHCNPQGGATLVVPYSSLIGSVLSAHNNWLSVDDANTPEEKKDERVIKCLICEQRHTKYETTHNASSKMINIFTWWEFLDAYLHNPSWIKPWVVFDEAHTDTPAYQALIEGLKKVKKRDFKIVEMSATFGDLPTSKKLTGIMVDYYVTDFEKLLIKNPEFFKKTVIVFTDDINSLNLKPLKANKVKYLVLNDSLKDYATDIVRSMEPPLLVFANRDYSVGFSFGDVNVISTGISTRIIIKNDKGEEQIIEGTSDFADFLQERGRGARDPKHSAICAALIATTGNYRGKLKDDYLGLVVEKYFKDPSEINKKALEKIIALMRKPKPIPELDPSEGNLNLNRILVRSLKEKLDHTKLFVLLPSEKGKREAGEFIFTNKLIKYFDKEQLPDLLIEATKDKVDAIAQQYEDWYNTPEEDDDFVFNNEADAKIVGFYFQAREKYEIKEQTATKLIIKFSAYKLDKNKLAV